MARFSPEQEDWIARHYPSLGAKKCAAALEAEFGIRMKPNALRMLAGRRGLKSRRYYSEAEQLFLHDVLPAMPKRAAAEAFAERFGRRLTVKQLRKFCEYHGFRTRRPTEAP